MADNYLEEKFESYEARKAAWEKARKLGKHRFRQSEMKRNPTQSASALAEEQDNAGSEEREEE